MAAKQNALGEYLRARRDLISPESVGIVREPGRRVDGLRRDEVAERAGISKEYYLRLEQGTGHQPSDQVLFALGRALLLDSAALDYLLRLASRTSSAAVVAQLGGWESARLDPAVAALLNQWSTIPAIVIDRNHDVVESNRLAQLFGAGQLDRGRNLVLNVFENRAVYENWEDVAAEALATLRFHGDPDDPRFRSIVAALADDPDFRRLWSRHDVRPLLHGEIRSQHRGRDGVNFQFQNLTIPGGGGFVMTLIFAEPGTPAGEILDRLAQGASAAPG